MTGIKPSDVTDRLGRDAGRRIRARAAQVFVGLVGVVPFFVFAIAFLVLLTLSLFVGSFEDREGNFTLNNIISLGQPFILDAYWLSIRVSLVTAVGGAIFGFLLAYASIMGGLPPFVRSALMTFSGVASQFAYVPLSFAFIATLGRVGLVTALINTLFGVNIRQPGLQPLYVLGSERHLYVLPVPADGAGHRSGDRWALARVARGLREFRRPPGSTGAISPCRS